MKKTLTRVLATVVVCFMFLISTAYDYTGSDLPELVPTAPTLRDTQGMAIDKYLEENSVTPYTDGERPYYTHTIFPADYGGVYREEDHLVLQIAQNAPSTQTLDFAQSMNIPTGTVKYSMNELNQMMSAVTDVIAYNKQMDIVTAYLNEELNIIKVGIFEMNDEKVRNAQELFEFNPMLTYHNESMREVVEEVTASPRDSLYTTRRNENNQLVIVRFSFGFAATRNFGGVISRGFVATGYAQDSIVGSEVFIDFDGSGSGAGVAIGTIQAISNSGTVDACFVVLYPGNVASNKIGTTSLSKPVTIKIHDYVSLYGALNQSTASVTETLATFTSNGVLFTEMGKANYLSAEGDSGGLIESGVAVAGIHKGSNASGSFFSKIDNINRELGTSVI